MSAAIAAHAHGDRDKGGSSRNQRLSHANTGTSAALARQFSGFGIASPSIRKGEHGPVVRGPNSAYFRSSV